MDSSAIRTFIFDLDGVIYRGDEAQPSAVETIHHLRSVGKRVYFLTNNSTQTRKQYADKLTRMGIPTETKYIMTSSYATALWFVENGYADRKVFVVGEIGIFEELQEAGIETLDSIDGERADFVVVGLDRSFTYEKLRIAQQALLNGGKLIATNRDPTYPLERGALGPGGGSIVSAIETAAGVESLLIGKPRTYSLELILGMSQTPPNEALMIGDRLDTDVMVGNRAGVHTALVLGGVTTREEAVRAVGEQKPEIIIDRLIDLAESEAGAGTCERA